jgi:sporulation integral membrane protein YtvI
MNTKKQTDFLIKTAFFTVIAIMVFLMLKLVSGPLFPFFAAAVLTVSLQKIIRKISKKLRIRKKAASVAMVILIYAGVGLITVAVCYVFYKQLLGFASNVPAYLGHLTDILQNISDKLNNFSRDMNVPVVGEFPSAAADKLTEKAAEWTTNFAGGLAAGVPAFLLSLLMTVVASAYFAKDYDEICEFFFDKVPYSVASKIRFAKNVILKNFVNMVRGYLSVMVMTFIELYLGLTVLGFKYALIAAAITAVLDILPVLGSGTVLIPWAFICFLSGDTRRTLGLVVLYLIITLVRNIAEPKIVGSKVGIHPLIMLASVFIGLKLFGAAGIILLPLAVIIIKSCLESGGILSEQPKKKQITKLCIKDISFKSKSKNKIKRPQ